jgi:hypothetical protein
LERAFGEGSIKGGVCAALSVGIAVFATSSGSAAERDAARMVRIAPLPAQLYGEAARMPAQRQDNGSKANS